MSDFWLYVLDYLPGIVAFFVGFFFTLITGKRCSLLRKDISLFRSDLIDSSAKAEDVERDSAESAQLSVSPEQLVCSSVDKIVLELSHLISLLEDLSHGF